MEAVHVPFTVAEFEALFARGTGWTCAVSAGLVLGGNLLSIVFEPAFFAVLAYPPSRLPVGHR